MSALRRASRRFLSRRERGNRIKTFVGNGPEAVCARPRGSRTEANRLNLVRRATGRKYGARRCNRQERYRGPNRIRIDRRAPESGRFCAYHGGSARMMGQFKSPHVMFRESSYVDGPPWQALFWRFERFGRLRSYVRPFDAEHMSAGLDEVRLSGSLSCERALRSWGVAGCS